MFNPVTGGAAVAAAAKEAGWRQHASLPSVNGACAHQAKGILGEERCMAKIGEKHSACCVHSNAKAADALPIAADAITLPRVCACQAGSSKTKPAGPEPPPRPSNLLKIHDLKNDLNFHSYSNIVGHQPISPPVATSVTLVRRASSGTCSLASSCLFMPASVHHMLLPFRFVAVTRRGDRCRPVCGSGLGL